MIQLLATEGTEKACGIFSVLSVRGKLPAPVLLAGSAYSVLRLLGLLKA